MQAPVFSTETLAFIRPAAVSAATRIYYTRFADRLQIVKYSMTHARDNSSF